jgi:MoxR-like ATPase
VFTARERAAALQRARLTAERLQANLEKVVLGKREEVRLALLALMGQGHLLIEDVPGVGKTMLAKSLARSVGCLFRRIQFTPDLLPSDIIGVTIYNEGSGEFQFRPGPVMAHILLADDLNRASPRTQAALLECMEEGQVTIDGVTRPVPEPFMVLATQSPLPMEGSFPLPPTQLDRFLMRLSLGYPAPSDEVQMLEAQRLAHPLESLGQAVGQEELVQVQQAVREVYVAVPIHWYVIGLVEATRQHPSLFLGASPRGSLALTRLAQARALLEGRDYVLPDDIKVLAAAALAHRTVVSNGARMKGTTAEAVIQEIVDEMEVPGAILSPEEQRRA